MKKNRTLCPGPSGQETIAGFGYMAFQFLFFPSLLFWCNGKLSHPLNDAELNFLFYLLNFLAVLLIFHDFLGKSVRQVMEHPAYFCQAVILGLAAYYACRICTVFVISRLSPDYQNYNDAAIASMESGSFFLTGLSTVILAPPVEECYFRGLIFRNLHSRSPWAAYLVSMAAFALVHILGYIGIYSPLNLTLAVLEYLPAGLCLAWAYGKGGTIAAPIVVHALINFASIRTLR